ncbi:Nucleosomal histone H3-Lys79 methylase [Geranomyces variabilis]|nr:Nucleosomal histone H3-Lys79 methylase [Geranomyces variabilis]
MIADGSSTHRHSVAASPPSPASDGAGEREGRGLGGEDLQTRQRRSASSQQQPAVFPPELTSHPSAAALKRSPVHPGTPKSADLSPTAINNRNSTPPLSLAPPSRLSNTNPISPALSLRDSPDLREDAGDGSLSDAVGAGLGHVDLADAFARTVPKENTAPQAVRCQSKTATAAAAQCAASAGRPKVAIKRKRRSLSGPSGETSPSCENKPQTAATSLSSDTIKKSLNQPVAAAANNTATAAAAAPGLKECTAARTTTTTAKERTAKKTARSLGDHRDHPKAALEPCISGHDLCKETPTLYCSLGDEDSAPSPSVNEFVTVDLEYPGVKASEVFPLLTPNKALEYNPTKDLYLTTAMIWEHCVPPNRRELLGDVKTGILRGIQRAVHRKSPTDLCAAIEEWNKQMVVLKTQFKAFNQAEFTGPPASYQMVSHILEQAYSRSVAPSSSLLNQYEGFSNNVYGEVKHNFVNTIIKEARIQPHHIFLDMGSGIANVVLQVAAQCLCYSYGIEVMDIPAKLAVQQRKEFISRMRYYAKPCGRIKLKHADFLEDSSFPEVIKSADVIFVNNYAFSAELNQRILGLFLDLKEGATVISLRSFLPVDRPTSRSTRRNNAIESIFTVKEHFFGRDCVSWMNEGGHYYIHKVDRKQLARRVR